MPDGVGVVGLTCVLDGMRRPAPQPLSVVSAARARTHSIHCFLFRRNHSANGSSSASAGRSMRWPKGCGAGESAATPVATVTVIGSIWPSDGEGGETVHVACAGAPAQLSATVPESELSELSCNV